MPRSTMTPPNLQQEFSEPILLWYDKYGRKDLPWQNPRDPYRIWVSEIMLQQTQVKTVIPYFNQFMSRFPDVEHLASASEDDVLAHWSGLGYYSRARNLHKTAKIIHTDFGGAFPDKWHDLIALPGIGPSTAAAIASLAFNQPTAILDGNVKRVLSRYFLVDGEQKPAVAQEHLWGLAKQCMPLKRCADYTQAIMDLGATCCTAKTPSCNLCPLQTTCLAKIKDLVFKYPIKRDKRKIPTRQQQFILLHTKESLIYLEKRPPNGLWGGLWCLPQIDTSLCPTTYIHQTYPFQTEEPKQLLTMKHTFSHFHLLIKAVSVEVKSSVLEPSNGPGQWFNQDELTGVGLAKPVSSIIHQFLNQDTLT